MTAALTSDIGVLQGAAFDGVVEEGTVEPAWQDGFDRGPLCQATERAPIVSPRWHAASRRFASQLLARAGMPRQVRKPCSAISVNARVHLFGNRWGRSAMIISQKVVTEGPSFAAWASTRAGLRSA